MEIMFEDLTPDAQKRLLEEAGVSRPEDMDWDELPVAVVEFDEPEYEFEDDEYADEEMDDIGSLDDTYDQYYD